MLVCSRLTSVSINVSLLAARRGSSRLTCQKLLETCGDSSAYNMVAVCNVSEQVSCSCNDVISLFEFYWSVDMVK